MKKILAALLLMINTSSQAQQDTILIFYDSKWEISTPDSSFYHRMAIEENGRWAFRDFFSDTRKIKSQGFFEDRGLTVRTGSFVFYHRNGTVQSEGAYEADEPEGLWLRWDEEGNIRDSIFYEKGIVKHRRSFYADGSLSDELLPDGERESVSKGYLHDGKIYYEGRYLNGKRQGEWIYYFDGGKQLVQYEGDSVVKFHCLAPDGQPISDCILEQEARPADGVQWAKFIREASLKYLPKAYFRGRLSGVVHVQFLVTSEGKVKDAVISFSSEPALNEAALKAIRSSPDWQPAVLHNRKVASYRTQPFKFARAE